MARKPRIEFEGAVYHVFNRGREGGPFATPGAAQTFVECLFEACERMHWRLHAYALTPDRYHLALETPRGNLTNGVHWLQSTFGNRHNRFRGGPAFQGRYRSILIEPGPTLLRLVDFIHLLPVRAGLIALGQLENFRWSSYRAFRRGPERRPAALRAGWLAELGGREDDAAGWRAYADHLERVLAEEGTAAPLSLCRGWACGSEAFRRERRRELRQMADARDWGGARLAEINRQEWEARLEAAIQRLHHELSEAPRVPKSAPWKVAVAAWLKRNTSATNRWLAERLCMGAPDAVSRYVAEALEGKRRAARDLLAALH